MMTSFNRVFKFAVTDFSRNILRSTSAVFVLVIVILLATGLFFMHGISSYVIDQVQNKIDITAYFKDAAAEADILDAKDQLVKADPVIKSIQYISKEDAISYGCTGPVARASSLWTRRSTTTSCWQPLPV